MGISKLFRKDLLLVKSDNNNKTLILKSQLLETNFRSFLKSSESRLNLSTGILNLHTLIFSAILVPAAIVGMRLGRIIQDRIDQSVFMKATLLVLMTAGVNLVRRALFA